MAQDQTAQIVAPQVVDNTSAQGTEQAKATPTPVAADPRLEQLARKERALGRQMQQFQEQKKALEVEKTRMADQVRAEMRQQFLEDPTKMGLSYQDISERYLRQPSPEDQREAALRREIEAVKEAQQKTLEQVSKSQQDAYEQAKKQISREVSSLVAANAEYELVRAQGAEANVVALIEETYKEEGVLLSTEEALKEVEDYLLEEATKLLSLEKVKAKLQPKAVEATPMQGEATTAQPKTGVRTYGRHTITESQTRPRPTLTQTTLTHAMSQASGKPTSLMNSRERAIAAFKGQLK